MFFALEGHFGVFWLPSHLGCLDRLQLQHKEETFRGGHVLHDGNVGFHLFFFFVTFVQLPFHALPLLSSHPASFRSLTRGLKCWLYTVYSCVTVCYLNSFEPSCKATLNVFEHGLWCNQLLARFLNIAGFTDPQNRAEHVLGLFISTFSDCLL